MKRILKKTEILRKENRLGVMTHIVVGYPDMKQTASLVREMIGAGADFVELQIPFSDPIADGPVILRASHQALEQGAKVSAAFDLAAALRREDPNTPLFFMGYSNTLLHYGIRDFVKRSQEVGIDGFIIPDLPPEEPEGEMFLTACKEYDLAPVFIFSPTSASERLRLLAEKGNGLMYCVARTGITGAETAFSEELSDFLERCRAITKLPLAVGFGLSKSEHVAFLRGKADIAVVGSETLRILEKEGIKAVGQFIRSLVETGKLE